MTQENLVVAPVSAGGPEVLGLSRRPIERPGRGQVLIRTAYAGINRHDCNQRARGVPPEGATDVLGLEVAGTIVEIGPGVPGERLGEEVCALVNGGGYACYTLAESQLALPLPRRLSLAQAAAVPEAAFTVWFNLVWIGGLKAGEVLLVHGGTSGIGSFAIQLARSLGARAIATAGTDEKCRVSTGLGAERAINYRTSDFVSEVMEATGGKGADVILDMAGAAYAERNLSALASDGRVIHLSSGGTQLYSAPLGLIMRKRARVTGSLMRPTPLETKSRIAADLMAHVWPLLGEAIVPLVDRVFPLAEVVAAHQVMESGNYIGKLLLSADT